MLAQYSGERGRLFHRHPVGRSAPAMVIDTLAHLLVVGSGCGDIHDSKAAVARAPFGQTALARAHAAEDQLLHAGTVPVNVAGIVYSSTPFWARTPASNACLIGCICVTVSATSISSGGAPRPVIMTCCSGGRRSSA